MGEQEEQEVTEAENSEAESSEAESSTEDEEEEDVTSDDGTTRATSSDNNNNAVSDDSGNSVSAVAETSESSETVIYNMDTTEIVEALTEYNTTQSTIGAVEIIGIYIVVGILLARTLWEHMKAG